MDNIVDLRESYDGDLIIENGDFADTGSTDGLAIEQLVRTILNTKPGDNSLWPYMGIDMDIYEGSLNTERVGIEIAKSIKLSITENSILYPFEVDVTPFPIGVNTVAFKVDIALPSGKTQRYVSAYDTKTNRMRSLNLNDSKEQKTIRVTVPPTINSRA